MDHYRQAESSSLAHENAIEIRKRDAYLFWGINV